MQPTTHQERGSVPYFGLLKARRHVVVHSSNLRKTGTEKQGTFPNTTEQLKIQRSRSIWSIKHPAHPNRKRTRCQRTRRSHYAWKMELES